MKNGVAIIEGSGTLVMTLKKEPGSQLVIKEGLLIGGNEIRYHSSTFEDVMNHDIVQAHNLLPEFIPSDEIERPGEFEAAFDKRDDQQVILKFTALEYLNIRDSSDSNTEAGSQARNPRRHHGYKTSRRVYT